MLAQPPPPPAPSFAAGYVAKVADFGLSVRINANQTHVSGQHHGTPLYIAPEVVQHGKVSPASDVYAFGIMVRGV